MGKFVYRIVILIGIVFFSVPRLNAQVILPPLERTISLILSGNSVKEVLVNIEEQAEFNFAYRSTLIDKDSRLTRTYVDKTVREILDDIFQTSLAYKQKGNYVILRTRPKIDEDEINIVGYFIDAQTKEKVPFVSIFDSLSLTSAVSDEYGYYTLKLDKKTSFNITSRKIGYHNKSVKLSGTGGSRLLNIEIDPLISIDTSEQGKQTFIEKLKNIKFLRPSSKQEANLENIQDSLFRNSQASIIPYVGTNGALSANTKVNYSFNLLGGVNGGVNKAELGGLFNINWDSVSYFQAAGLFNSVGGPQKGVQMAGLANLNLSSFNGVQYSGFVNLTCGQVSGAQFAGFANYAKEIKGGAQLAGYVNIARNVDGAQIAGFSNNVLDSSRGAQLAGFINVAKKKHEGIQAAGFVNYAKEIKGVQLGFININDTIDGVSIGFFNFSRRGYRQLEVSSDEILAANIAFKTGTHKFYNTFTAGLSLNENVWGYGYGIGTSLPISNRSRLFFDLQASSLHSKEKIEYDDFSLLNKLTVSYHFQLFNKLAIAAGPSFNLLLIDNSTTAFGTKLKGLAPYNFYDERANDNFNIQMWVGGYVAIRFF